MSAIEFPLPTQDAPRRHQSRTTSRASAERPPHPFVVAADELEASSPARARELLARWTAERGPRFVAVVTWALEERRRGGGIVRCRDGCGRPAAVMGFCDRCYHRHHREARRR